MPPEVSIITLNYNHPKVITRMIESLQMTRGIDYELVVVDNGSNAPGVEAVKAFAEGGLIHTLVLEPVNHWFSEGNNIGVAHSNSESKYILLLNSDVGLLRSDWLTKVVEWMEGVPEILPYTWSDKFESPHPGPRGIVSVGWTHDTSVPGYARPEGWCLLIRRELWQDISPDFPWYYGIEEMLANVIRGGARCGVLCQYSKYITHFEGGSNASSHSQEVVNRRKPAMVEWFKGLSPSDTLDFTLGPNEYQSYGEW